jgi:hypothetical protein
MAAGVNHHHQRRTDRQRGDDARACPDYRAANCQDEKKRSDEFGDILVHSYFLGQSASKKQEHQQWDFGTTRQISENLVFMWVTSILSH